MRTGLPTSETLHQLLRHDEQTGILYWRERPPELFLGGCYDRARRCASWNSRCAGKPALNYLRSDGYLTGSLLGRHQVKAHRVVWAMAHGYWPKAVDHIDGDQANNRLSNLREVSHRTNMQNQKRYASNTSGVSGVNFDKTFNKWTARIGGGVRRRKLGAFATREEAVAAVIEARRAEGYHPNHGR